MRALFLILKQLNFVFLTPNNKMSKTRVEQIVELMQGKSVAKQQAYIATLKVMNEFKKVLGA
jgi:hypothetical protein